MNFTRSFFTTSDYELINSLNKGGSEKIKGEERLFNCYSYFIPEAIQKYSLSQDEAFDAYADTILAGIEKISKGVYQGRASLKTWLFQIFHNKCVDLLRKKTTNKSSVYRTAEIADSHFLIGDPVKSILQKLVDKTDFDILKQKLSQLGESCRQILQQWTEGFSDKEIAVNLAYKSAEVVKTTRLRCLEKLRKLYKNES
jgi:RNA polymerase sigma-70 factor (ECF subfamily)